MSQEEIDKTNTKQEEFESEQNLLGLFAILLAVDRRIKLFQEKIIRS